MKEILHLVLNQIENEHLLLGDEELERRWLPMVDLFRRDIKKMLEDGSLDRDEAVQAQMALNKTLPEPELFSPTI